MRTYELIPVNNRKSFYGKARVEIDDNGNETLISYTTRILTRKTDGTLIKLWDGWTATTGNHIKAFCGLNKKQYEAL